ncbi:MAG: GNAT family N-acetyltransferase [Planctomycetota bacterium]|nr:GNAT family N-acetyltransferase [Planctomycetota bacterium]MDA1164739.1 GNAT family N-acetyltransferase [Planctomycetota bacterium]
MISNVQVADLEEIRNVIADAVQENVASSDDEAVFLIDDIDSSLSWWLKHKDSTQHLKFSQDGRILGVILIKKHWNLTNLFVHPSHQGKGIGRALVLAGLEACRDRSPKGKLQVNSSANAVDFYKRLGFERAGPEIDRPGGCVPLEYLF